MSEEIMYKTEELVDNLQPEETTDTQKFLIFMIDDLKLGVYAEYVVEILTNQPITYLPMLPDFVRGIINMRGQMIPILDIRLRLGKPFQEDGLVIVLNVEGMQLGLMVDGVDQMTDIPTSSILPVPAQSSVHLLVSGMCSLPDGFGTMMVLDCAQLLPHD